MSLASTTIIHVSVGLNLIGICFTQMQLILIRRLGLKSFILDERVKFVFRIFFFFPTFFSIAQNYLLIGYRLVALGTTLWPQTQLGT